MALNETVLKSNALLGTLTPEQVSAILTMSATDENTVIATRIGEIYGGLDNDVKEVSGIEKQAGEKTYNYTKRVIAEMKAKAASGSELESKMAKLAAEKADLERKIADGSVDTHVKQKLSDTEQRLTQTLAQYEADKNNWQKTLKDHEAQLTKTQVMHEFDKALNGIKFKDEKLIPKAVRDTYVSAAISGILTETQADFIDDGRGGKRLVFRDANGQIKNNPENKLNPFTAEEMIKDRIKEILDVAAHQTGAGSASGRATGDVAVDVSNATTQVEADEIITDYLLKKGITKDKVEFRKQMMEIRTKNNVSKLPIR